LTSDVCNGSKAGVTLVMNERPVLARSQGPIYDR
jgi:hypothetical protein